MFVVGIVVGIAEIVLGIIICTSSHGDGIVLTSGIGYILSGLLFIWLCAGASQAFANTGEIDRLKRDVKKLQVQNKVYLKLFEKTGLSEEDINLFKETSLDYMSEGTPLIALIDKTLVKSGVKIPKYSELSFVRMEYNDNGENNVIVDVVINEQNHRVRYKEQEVISKRLYSEETK